MTQLAHLDTVELTNWLTRVTQTIDRSLRAPAREEAITMLRSGLNGTKAGLPVLAQLALLDDCLRVAHEAIEADGVIEADELARIADLVRVAASKYCFALAPYEAFSEGLSSSADIARFLRVHRTDAGPFGYANETRWRGLELTRTVERRTRNASPLREHERMLDRVMEEVFDGRQTDAERQARRRLRELFERPIAADVDPRIVAFCRNDGPEVFSCVAHGSQIHESDPYDVESIHAEAREVFHREVERATIPASHTGGQGHTILILGESGCGKTHLLRALRAQVHSRRMGYVGYVQMTTEVGDYTRYVLRGLVDSMERPYDAPGLAESSLMYLSDGVVEGRVQIPPGELEQLRTAELSPEQLDATIGKIVDRILRTEGLEKLEVDLLHALLLLQRRDPALQKRVVRFLRCEPLTTYDRQLLGGLAPRDQPEDPLRTLRQLAAIMYELHFASLVLVVDQVEDAIPDGQTVTKMQIALDALRNIADAIPSAVIVVACLDDVYDSIRGKLSNSLVDRLEQDPVPVRLSSAREADEVEQMLVRRLEALYSAFDVPWREDDPYFPFAPEQLQSVVKLRARDVLAKFRAFHASCIAAGGIPTTSSTASPPPPPPPPPPDAVLFERSLQEAMSNVRVPDDDEEILTLVEEALREAATEHGIDATMASEKVGKDRALALTLRRGRCLAMLCNKKPQSGSLGKQLDALRVAAKGNLVFALRGSDWQFPPKGATSQKVGEFKAAGGKTVVIEDSDLRVLLGMKALAKANPPGFAAWRKTERPLARVGFLSELLDLDRAEPAPEEQPVVTSAERVPPTTPSPLPPIPEPKARPSGSQLSTPPDELRLGALTTIRAEPVHLPLEQIKKHVSFLGSSGSGKTTFALSVVEQLLERGISVLLVDRKGDLSRYASESWWADRSFGDPKRKAALRDRIDVALYTPGNVQGRPLRLPILPSLSDASPQDREQLARFAASGLSAMMGLGRGVATTHKESVLKCAIELLADQPDVTLDMLCETILRPDPQLLAKVDTLQRHFAQLGECLQSLKIQRGSLLSGDGELMDVAQMLPPPGGRPRLTIINTAAFAEVAVLQFWVSRLLVDLGRLAKKRPWPTLQGVAFFDEADSYVPASSNPPTKDPMFELLRRARGGGIGIMLATQNPGDFDYKARDNIGTWLVGKVSQDRAIEKMRNLLAGYPNVSARLATQPPGAFFVLADGPPKEIRADRALMATEQMTEQEVADLARLQRPRT